MTALIKTTIEDLNPIAAATREHFLAVMKDGAAGKLTVGQVLDLLIGSAPGALDTLEELAAALADDEDFAATITTLIGTKAASTDVAAALALKSDILQPLTNIASAATMDIGAVSSKNLRVTGSVGISSYGTAAAGTVRRMSHEAALTITRNVTTLETPTAANLAVAAGDEIVAVATATGWRIVSHVRANSPGINLAASVASTSGTSVDFTGIPSSAKRVTLILSGVSTSGTNAIVVQAGTSGGVDATGYNGIISRLGSATLASAGEDGALYANVANDVQAARTYTGKIIFEKVSGNLWTIVGSLSCVAGVATYHSVWSKTLSADLDRVRLTTAGGVNTFDAGTVAMSYEI